MKKGVIIAIIVALLLCGIITVGGGAIWYFLLRNNPQKSFREAFDELENGDYYQYTAEGTVTATISFPDYPEYDMDMDMSMSGEGKEDIQNEKAYSKYTQTQDGTETEVEKYKIDDTIYTSTNGSDFIESDSSESEDESFFQVLNNAAEKEEYTVLDNEDVNGESCYHYKVELDDEQIDIIADEFTKAMVDASSELEDMELEIEVAELEIWTSKSTNKLMKFITKFENMRFDQETQGITMDVNFNINYTMFFTNWGEKVDIESPI